MQTVSIDAHVPGKRARRPLVRSSALAARVLLCAVLACVGAGCISLAPQTERPPLPVPETYPADSADATPIDDVPTAVRAAVPRWQAYFSDPRLRALIETALRENRDQHAARARIEAARAVYGIRRSAQWPGVDANAAAIRFRAPGGLLFPQPVIGDLYEVSLVESSWEIDLWGRVRGLKDAALEDYLAIGRFSHSRRSAGCCSSFL